MSAIIVLIDLIAFSIFYAAKIFSDKLGYTLNSDATILTIVTLYFIFAILAYTFFKHIIIKIINSLTQKTKLNLQKFWKFFTLNLTMIIIFFFTYLVMSALLKYLIKPQYLGIIAYITITAYSIIIYLFINASHFIFAKEQKVWKTIKETTKELLKKTKTYLGIIISSAILLLPFYLLYLLIALTAKYTIFTTNQAYITHGRKYQMIIQIMIFAFIYLLLFINRVYFKLATDKTR
jgi:hypothetical protein